MQWNTFLKSSLVFVPLLSGCLFVSCQRDGYDVQTENDTGNWWALGDSLEYVGIETCKNCHYDIYSTFTHTGMGSSFGLADTAKSAIPAIDTLMFQDPYTGLYYQPYFKAGNLCLHEFKLSDRDTTYSLHTPIQYVIGSGHHTNSHIIDCNGYLFQAPFTYYTQSGTLDLPPGFEGGHNSRYSRPIGLECMSCHNAMPTGFVPGSENKFAKVPMGIDCERCHGPGSGHVQKILRGNITDTSQVADYSIVNPKRLPVSLRFELCQRCHLQGNAVLADGKSFFDFRPGMILRQVMDVYLPKYEDDEHFIMASHADRLSQSKCFIQSKNKMDCTTCHNPHISSRGYGDAFFNQKCASCHTKNDCTEKKSVRSGKEHNCVTCHMPVSGSIDIPHVTIHDHEIGIHKKVNSKQKKEKIIALIAINNVNPTLKSRIKSYLQQYEKFESLDWYLDSAFVLLSSTNKRDFIREWVHYLYLKNNRRDLYLTLYPMLKDLINYEIFLTPSWDNENAWFWYRTAHLTELYYSAKEAVIFYKKAMELAPYHYDFQSKYAISLAKNGYTKDALNILETIHKEIPFLHEVSNNIGYLYLLQNSFQKAEYYLQSSLSMNPLYPKAYQNLLWLYNQSGRRDKIDQLLEKIKREIPTLYRELNLVDR